VPRRCRSSCRNSSYRVRLADGSGRRGRRSLAELTPLLTKGDAVIDGGNSYYVDDIRRAHALRDKGLDYVDVGTTRCVGLDRGYCMMIGGPDATVTRLDPILKTLAPGIGDIAHARTREGRRNVGTGLPALRGTRGALREDGAQWHRVRLMRRMPRARILRSANIGKQKQEVNAETTPLRDPELYQYDLNLPDITEVWRRGSVVASWLLDLTASALMEDPQLAKFEGRVSDSVRAAGPSKRPSTKPFPHRC